MANPYFICAYGPAIRVSERVRADTMAEHNAAMDTFGIGLGGTDRDRVTVLRINGKGWKYLSSKDKRGHMMYLARLHYKRTGNVCGGFTVEELKPEEPKRGKRAQLPGGNG